METARPSMGAQRNLRCRDQPGQRACRRLWHRFDYAVTHVHKGPERAEYGERVGPTFRLNSTTS